MQSNPGEIRELHEDVLINVTYFFRDPEVFETLKSTSTAAPAGRIAIRRSKSGFGLQAVQPAKKFTRLRCAFSNTLAEVRWTLRSRYSARMRVSPVFRLQGQASIPSRLRPKCRPSACGDFCKNGKGISGCKTSSRSLYLCPAEPLPRSPVFAHGSYQLPKCADLLWLGTAAAADSDVPLRLTPGRLFAARNIGNDREFTGLFSLYDRKNKYYQRTVATVFAPWISIRACFFPKRFCRICQSMDSVADLELQAAADRIVLARYGPPGVVVNERLEILQSRGHTAPYLEIRHGAATLQLPRMARENIASQVVDAVHRAIENDLPVQFTACAPPRARVCERFRSRYFRFTPSRIGRNGIWCFSSRVMRRSIPTEPSKGQTLKRSPKTKTG